jgi:hypothetical protein
MPIHRLNIDYWASLYDCVVGDNREYERGISKSDLPGRAEALWNWKDLGRGVKFDEVKPVLEELEIETYINDSPSAAVEDLRTELQTREIINSETLVTPAFLLHLAACNSGKISENFPIYDRRVWNAYVYLWNIRSNEEQLYTEASTSPQNYGEFCEAFSGLCQGNADARRYERALFMFGQFIMNIGNRDERTKIADINETLESYESVIQRSRDENGFALAQVRD